MDLIVCGVVCDNKKLGIGYQNSLCCDIKEDKLFFKNMTLNSNVIMGKNTFISLGEKPLDGRNNIILTHDKEYSKKHLDVVTNTDNSYLMKSLSVLSNCFIIGGSQIYSQFLPYTSFAHVTKVLSNNIPVDSYIEDLYYNDDWIPVIQTEWKDGYDRINNKDVKYCNVTYKNKNVKQFNSDMRMYMVPTDNKDKQWFNVCII